MAWIESHQGLVRHPKTKKLMRKLNIYTVEAIGYLHLFWWWAMDFAEDGDLSRFDEYDIADACEWKGSAGEFFDALHDAGFIDETEDGFIIHDWYEYAGKLIEIRKKDAERKRNSRGKSKLSIDIPEDVQRMSSGQQKDSGGNLTESIRDLDLNLNLNKNNKHKTSKDVLPKTEFAEEVWLTENEYSKLCTEYGEDVTKMAISMLSNYKGANGKKYKSDYKAMLNWTMEKAIVSTSISRKSENYSNQKPKTKQQLAVDMEIARNQWIAEGKDPNDFIFEPSA